MFEQFQKNSPFSHEGLIKSINTFGGQRESKNERFPIPISELNPEPHYKWLANMELDVPSPSKQTKIGNREMNRKEYELYANMVGTAMNKGIQKMYEREFNPENTDKKTMEEIQDEIDSLYNKAKSKAKEIIIKKIIETHKLQEEKQNETN
jgi:glucuronate isomerase